MTSSKVPFSQAAENNKGPILQVLQQHCQAPGTLLEIGAGTGQHAAWLSAQLPHLQWQPSDVAQNLPTIRHWLGQTHSPANAPLALDVSDQWPIGPFDYLFTANTFHIMPQSLVAHCIAEGCRHLNTEGLFMVYGPFNYDGQFTSDSNRQFNGWLKAADPQRGIRDKEWIEQEFARHGRQCLADHEMPANNRVLVFG